MDRYILKSMRVKNLKGIKDAEFNFTETLTAIMGVNGSGKTTVIHALACVYQPLNNKKGENHKFSEFFVPNTDSFWKGSEFDVINKKIGEDEPITKKYTKTVDRWKPKYSNRIKRDVYYIGIDTCLPDIEKEKKIG